LLLPGAGAETGSVTGKKDADNQFDAWFHESNIGAWIEALEQNNRLRGPGPTCMLEAVSVKGRTRRLTLPPPGGGRFLQLSTRPLS